jgi:dTDP-4-dehydrorhamnose reductase
MRVVVLGASGLLGSTLVPYLKACGHFVVQHRRSGDGDIGGDLTSADETAVALDASAGPDVIINLAALTDVDHCEGDPQRAYRLNVRIVENVVRWIRDRGAGSHLVQMSTDQIYDGSGSQRESDVTLCNYYGFSKYAAELVAATVPSTVLRTNFIGRSRCPNRNSLSDWLIQSLRRGEPFTVFTDVRFSPLSLTGLGELVELVCLRRERGIFNVGARDGISKADLAFSLAEALGLSAASMTRGLSSTVNLVARRPRDMSMDSSRFEQTFGVLLPDAREVMQSVLREYRS